MPTPLAAGQISLRDPDTGGNITVFSVDPSRYDVFAVPKRGSSHPVLDGTQVHQDFGVHPEDFTITLDVEITDYVTYQDLYTKFRNTGAIWEMRDWFPNKFNVIFAPGDQSFHFVPIRGSCDSFEGSMVFKVIEIVEFFGAPY